MGSITPLHFSASLNNMSLILTKDLSRAGFAEMCFKGADVVHGLPAAQRAPSGLAASGVNTSWRSVACGVFVSSWVNKTGLRRYRHLHSVADRVERGFQPDTLLTASISSWRPQPHPASSKQPSAELHCIPPCRPSVTTTSNLTALRASAEASAKPKHQPPTPSKARPSRWTRSRNAWEVAGFQEARRLRRLFLWSQDS